MVLVYIYKGLNVTVTMYVQCKYVLTNQGNALLGDFRDDWIS